MCLFATSQPDLTVLHNINCVYDSEMIGCALTDVPEDMISPLESEQHEMSMTDKTSYSLIGDAGEDKVKENGESQTVADFDD